MFCCSSVSNTNTYLYRKLWKTELFTYSSSQCKVSNRNYTLALIAALNFIFMELMLRGISFICTVFSEKTSQFCVVRISFLLVQDWACSSQQPRYSSVSGQKWLPKEASQTTLLRYPGKADAVFSSSLLGALHPTTTILTISSLKYPSVTNKDQAIGAVKEKNVLCLTLLVSSKSVRFGYRFLQLTSCSLIRICW